MPPQSLPTRACVRDRPGSRRQRSIADAPGLVGLVNPAACAQTRVWSHAGAKSDKPEPLRGDQPDFRAKNAPMAYTWLRPLLIVGGTLGAIGAAAFRAKTPCADCADDSAQHASDDNAGGSDKAAGVAARFVCEMHCEPGKAYPHEGKCPVCAMKLTAWDETGYALRVATPGTGELRHTLLDPSGVPVHNLGVDGQSVRVTMLSPDLKSVETVPAEISGDQFIFAGFGKAHAGWTVFAELLSGGKPAPTWTSVGAQMDDVRASAELPAEDFDMVAHDGDYELRIRCNGQKFIVGERSFVRIGVSVRDKAIADLEALPNRNGARGELLIMSATPARLVRTQELELAEHATDARLNSDALVAARHSASLNGQPSDMVFSTVFPRVGVYRVNFEAHRAGKPIRATWYIHAEAPGSGEQDAEQHKHHHAG